MSQNLPVKQSSNVPATFDNMLENFFTDPWFPFKQQDFKPFKLDVKEDDNNYTIEAEMSGVKKKDISLDLDYGVLTIGVEGREDMGDGKKKTVHKERLYTYQERTVYLADAADSGATAKLDNGELIVTVPKQHQGATNQKIAVE